MTATERPTLESVARHASVSRQTVSNVLNSPHRVRPETLDRVRAAIDELGYRPHLAARQLRTKRSRVIGMRLEPVRDGINVLDRFLHALAEEAQRAGYRVVLFTAPDDEGEIEQYEELLDAADVDAFVLASTHHGDPRTSWLGRRGVPFVTFGRPWGNGSAAEPAHPWVDVDGAAGTRAAVEHLHGLGHRRVAFLGWPGGSGVGDDRRAGWRNALTELVGTNPRDVAALDAAVVDGVDTGAAATRELLAAGPTAVVCASDSLALGAMAASNATGRQLSVVGFDDTPVAAAVGLTSVAQPLAEAAAHATALLLYRLDGSTTPSGVPDTVRLLPPRLVPRASTTPPQST